MERTIDFSGALTLTFGGIVGAPLFLLLGKLIGMAGPASLLSLFLAFVISFLTVTNFAELSSSIPKEGGSYQFIKEAYGSYAAYIIGIFLILGTSAFALISSYGILYSLEPALPLSPHPLIFNILAVGIFALISYFFGKKLGNLQLFLTTIPVLCLLIFIGAALSARNPDNYSPLIPTDPILPSGEIISDAPLKERVKISVFDSVFFIFTVYLGFASLSQASSEVLIAGKNIPRAFLVGLSLAFLLYFAVDYALIGVAPKYELSQLSAPLLSTAEKIMGPIGFYLVTVAGVLASISSLNASLIGASRLISAMAKDGQIPEFFSKFDKKRNSPYIALFSTFLLSSTFAFIGNLNTVVYLANFLFFLSMSAVNLSVISLRRKKPEIFRPFKAPLYPANQIFVTIFILYLTTSTSLEIFAATAGVLVLSSLYYSLNNKDAPSESEEQINS